MFPFRKAFLLFWVHHCAGQIFSPFAPFPPVPPPPFIMFYTFPPVTLQARARGGLQASIPDDCGIESFEFESRKNLTEAWKGGNVTSKTEGNWIFEDPSILLAPGESLFYRCRIKQRGSFIANPDAEWVVPDDLAEEFDPPKPPKKTEECPENQTPKPEDRKKKTTPKPSERKEETTAKPDEEEPTGNPEDESTDEPEMKKEKKKPEKKKSPEKMKPDEPEEEKDPKTPECPAPGPTAGETREEVLERKLWKVQCDMIQLAERSFKLNEALSFELTELKKLNYVVVTRIQRLESLLRNLNRPAPFPSPYY
uniref:CBM39 domain-containing protein n=1 Tax=Lygus hesperus TaxID=30085 RepID=A0A146LZB8_LYGHE